MPADMFAISGKGSLMFDSVRIDGQWRAARDALGAGAATTGLGGISIVFCRHPHIEVIVLADERVVGPFDNTFELDRIPTNARVYRINIYREPVAPVECMTRG